MPSHLVSLGGLLIVASARLAAAQTIAGNADYLIVGGGPAGFVLAEQLSRNPQTHVVLLEAGPDGINSSQINSTSLLPQRGN